MTSSSKEKEKVEKPKKKSKSESVSSPVASEDPVLIEAITLDSPGVFTVEDDSTDSSKALLEDTPAAAAAAATATTAVEAEPAVVEDSSLIATTSLKSKDDDKPAKSKKKSKKRTQKKKRSPDEESGSVASGSSYYHYDSDSSISSSGSELSLLKENKNIKDKKILRGLAKEASRSSLLDSASIKNGNYRGRNILMSDDEDDNSSNPDEDNMSEFIMDLSFLTPSSPTAGKTAITLKKPRVQRVRSTGASISSMGFSVDSDAELSPPRFKANRVKSTGALSEAKSSSFITEEKEKSSKEKGKEKAKTSKEKDKKDKRKKDKHGEDVPDIFWVKVGTNNVHADTSPAEFLKVETNANTVHDTEASTTKRKSKKEKTVGSDTVGPAVEVKAKSNKAKTSSEDDTVTDPVSSKKKPKKIISTKDSETSSSKKGKDVESEATNESEFDKSKKEMTDTPSDLTKASKKKARKPKAADEDTAGEKDIPEEKKSKSGKVVETTACSDGLEPESTKTSKKKFSGEKTDGKRGKDSPVENIDSDIKKKVDRKGKDSPVEEGDSEPNRKASKKAKVGSNDVHDSKEKSDRSGKSTITTPTSPSTTETSHLSRIESGSLRFDKDDQTEIEIYHDDEDDDIPPVRASTTSSSMDSSSSPIIEVEQEGLRAEEDATEDTATYKKKAKEKKDKKKHRANSIDLDEDMDPISPVHSGTSHTSSAGIEGQDYYIWNSKKHSKSPKKSSKSKKNANDVAKLISDALPLPLSSEGVVVTDDDADLDIPEAVSGTGSKSSKKKKKIKITKQDSLPSITTNEELPGLPAPTSPGEDDCASTTRLPMESISPEEPKASEGLHSEINGASQNTLGDAAGPSTLNSMATDNTKEEKNNAVVTYISTTLELALLDPSKYKDEAMITFIQDFPQAASITFDLGSFPNNTKNGAAFMYLLSVLCALGASREAVLLAYDLNPDALQAHDQGVGTPLHYAISYGLAAASTREKWAESIFPMIEFLLEKESLLLESQSNNKSQSVLHQAILSLCDPAATEFADPTDSEGNNDRHLIELADVVVTMLLEKQPLLATLPDSEGLLPLHLAAKHAVPVAILQRILIETSEAGCSAQCTSKGYTPLHYAAELLGQTATSLAVGTEEKQNFDGEEGQQQFLDLLFAPLELYATHVIILTEACPNAARIADHSGNLPLHVLFGACEREIDRDIPSLGSSYFVNVVSAIVDAWPGAVNAPGSNSETIKSFLVGRKGCDAVTKVVCSELLEGAVSENGATIS